MPRHLKLSLGLSVTCLSVMILFNHLATKNEFTRGAYLDYANYSFECLKIVFGGVLVSVAAALEHKKALRAYEQKIQSLNTLKDKDEQQ
jgi:hypothetical protein